MKLTLSQEEALRILAARAPEQAWPAVSNDVEQGYIASGSARRLESLGLAEARYKPGLTENTPRWHITDAGRLAVEALDAHASKEDA